MLVGIMLVGIVPVGIAPVGIGTASHYCHVLKSNKRLLLRRLLLPFFALTSTSQSFSPDLKLSCFTKAQSSGT